MYSRSQLSLTNPNFSLLNAPKIGLRIKHWLIVSLLLASCGAPKPKITCHHSYLGMFGEDPTERKVLVGDYGGHLVFLSVVKGERVSFRVETEGIANDLKTNLFVGETINGHPNAVIIYSGDDISAIAVGFTPETVNGRQTAALGQCVQKLEDLDL